MFVGSLVLVVVLLASPLLQSALAFTPVCLSGGVFGVKGEGGGSAPVILSRNNKNHFYFRL